MKKELDGSLSGYLHRHLSQLKLLTRLVDHELGASKPGNDISLDRDLVENLLDCVEIFVEDMHVAEGAGGNSRQRGERGETRVSTADNPKSNVTRLN